MAKKNLSSARAVSAEHHRGGERYPRHFATPFRLLMAAFFIFFCMRNRFLAEPDCVPCGARFSGTYQDPACGAERSDARWRHL
jgi:hypothetical protein